MLDEFQHFLFGNVGTVSDLNPIRHRWDERKQRLRVLVSDLRNALLDERANISTDTLKSCRKPSQESGSCCSCTRLNLNGMS